MIGRKIGRNKACYCGSGKKFKKCHGTVSSNPQPLPMPPGMADRARLAIAQSRAKERQRQDQQGLGKPIISTELNGIRVVAVGNTVMYSAKWKTVFDFLGDYLRAKLGESWGKLRTGKTLGSTASSPRLVRPPLSPSATAHQGSRTGACRAHDWSGGGMVQSRV